MVRPLGIVTSQSRSPLPNLEIRRPKFELSAALPRYWHGGDPFRTHFFNALSAMFPVGELYFIESVRLFQREVSDQKLAAEVKAFVGQESMHRNAHGEYNDLLRAQGYDIDRLEARLRRRIAFIRRFLPEKNQLAVVLAYEHFTAILADFVLREPRALEGAHPAYQAIWRWHAAEEIEHKSVAFDVYRAVGGGYLRRVLEFTVASILFLVDLFYHLSHFLRRDGLLFRPRLWARGLYFMLVTPGVFRRLLPAYLRYLSPFFHPWNHDNRALIASRQASNRDGAASTQ